MAMPIRIPARAANLDSVWTTNRLGYPAINRTALSPTEIHIGLVYEDHVVGVGGDDLLHIGQGQGYPGGGVGVGEYHASLAPAQSLHIHRKIRR